MSIAHAILSESQVRLWPWLFGHPNQAFHLNELKRLTGLGSASLQRELNRLVIAGLVTSETFGNLRLFKADSRSLIFSELVGITKKLLGVSTELFRALEPHQERLHWVAIYGSVAKAEDTSTSDIDVMLVGNKLRLSEVLNWLDPAEQALKRKINPTLYTEAEFVKRLNEQDSFVNKITKQPHELLIGSLDGFRRAQKPGQSRPTQN
jgi:predicted nucleotidyltransferase